MGDHCQGQYFNMPYDRIVALLELFVLCKVYIIRAVVYYQTLRVIEHIVLPTFPIIEFINPDKEPYSLTTV
jgi:hypothetical protein